MSSQTHKRESPSAVEPTVERIGRMVVIGVLGGIAAGFLVGGIANRLIMRILAMVNWEKAGVMTENGKMTAGGTIGLIVFVGLISGIIGGLMYVVIRRWLPGYGLLKGLAFGLVLLCFFGTIVFDPDNIDFALFGPRELSVGLFALLFPLYGIVVSLVVERYDRYVPPFFNSFVDHRARLLD